MDGTRLTYFFTDIYSGSFCTFHFYLRIKLKIAMTALNSSFELLLGNEVESTMMSRNIARILMPMARITGNKTVSSYYNFDNQVIDYHGA